MAPETSCASIEERAPELAVHGRNTHIGRRSARSKQPDPRLNDIFQLRVDNLDGVMGSHQEG